MVVMFLLFLLQVFQRLSKHECDDADAGYRKQKVRLSPPFGLIPSWNGVKPAPCLSVKPT